jgi:hypothetical protein
LKTWFAAITYLMKASFPSLKNFFFLFNEVVLEVFSPRCICFDLRQREIIFQGYVIEILGRVAGSKSELNLPNMRAFGNCILVVFTLHCALKI